jgi:hypothetical protein
MPNTSLISTVSSEFSIYLGDCEQTSYDFSLEIAQKEKESIHVRLLLQGDGLSLWASDASLEDELYNAVRGLPIVHHTIRAINRRANDEARQAL